VDPGERRLAAALDFLDLSDIYVREHHMPDVPIYVEFFDQNFSAISL
jgi:hypothetical protein